MEKVFQFDRLRGIACFSIVWLHVSSIWVTQGATKYYYWIGNLSCAACRWALPCFVVISGALLLQKEISNYSSFYVKRYSRIIPALLFWAIPYMLIKGQLSPHSYFVTILKSGIYVHFWYLYMIMGLYLFTPFLGKLVRSLKRNELLLLTAICLLLGFLWEAYKSHFEIKGSLWLFSFLPYIGYFLLGYLLVIYKNIYTAKWFRYFIFLFICITTLIAYAYSRDAYFYRFLNPFVFAQLITVFLPLYHGRVISRDKRLDKLIIAVSKYSLGIYMSHLLFIHFLGRYMFSGDILQKTLPLIAIPLITIMVFFISMALSYLLSRIPLLKYTV